MRHTLVPANERKALRWEYRIRLIVVYLFFASLVGLVGVGALFPAFMHARQAEQAQLNLVEQLKQKHKSTGYTAVEDALRKDQKIVSFLNTSVPIRMSALAQSIISLRENVRLTSFNFTPVGTTTVTVSLLGKAPTRNDLLSFKSRLENNLPGSKVELPIGVLAKSTNIDFTLEVKYKLP